MKTAIFCVLRVFCVLGNDAKDTKDTKIADSGSTMHLVTILIVLLPLLLAAALLWVRRRHEQALRDELSPISRQHIDLFQGGQLSESAIESTKARFRDLLERGEV